MKTRNNSRGQQAGRQTDRKNGERPLLLRIAHSRAPADSREYRPCLLFTPSFQHGSTNAALSRDGAIAPGAAMDISLEEAINRGGGPIRRGKGSARPSPYGKGGGRGGSKGGGGKGGGGKNVYVGNLTWTVSWQDLKDHFKTIGPVLNADVMQEPDGRSKGCGLVTFQNARDADRAIRELHDTEINGRNIFVREDRDAPGGGGGGGGKGGGGGGSSSTVYVGNLSYHTAWQDLKDLCKEVGTVLHADVMMEEDGRSKGCGLVKFATAHGQTLVVPAAPAPAPAPATYLRLGTLSLAHGGSAPPRAELRRLSPRSAAVEPATGASGSEACVLILQATAREASRAIAELHDAELDGRKIFVREDRETAGGSGCKLYVGNLSADTTWMDLKDLFREAVRVRTCTCTCTRTCMCTLG